jgi:quercetin dioxygenase-like cupin family protein
MDTNKLIAINAPANPWQERLHEPTGKVLFRKDLYTDPDTGMEVRMVRYPKGFINPLHTHNCAHGMYVLEGTLQTHEGSYGPGHFVWFPEGNRMEHGATAEEDVTVLFITNKPFDIHYQKPDGQQG